MFDDEIEDIDVDVDRAERTPVSRAAREEQRRRNALARHKLELRCERERLQALLTEVWEEPDGFSAFPRRLRNGRHSQEVNNVTVAI